MSDVDGIAESPAGRSAGRRDEAGTPMASQGSAPRRRAKASRDRSKGVRYSSEMRARERNGAVTKVGAVLSNNELWYTPETRAREQKAADAAADAAGDLSALLEVMLPIIIGLDQAHVDACHLEGSLSGAAYSSCKARAYPSTRWYSLLGAGGAPKHPDPVLFVARSWTAEMTRNSGKPVELSVSGAGVLGDNQMAAELRRFLRQAFEHRPSRLTLVRQPVGTVRVYVTFADTRARMTHTLRAPRRTPADNEIWVRAGWFLALEADHLIERLDRLETDYNLVARESVVASVTAAAAECKRAADILIRRDDPLGKLFNALSSEAGVDVQASSSPDLEAILFPDPDEIS